VVGDIDVTGSICFDGTDCQANWDSSVNRIHLKKSVLTENVNVAYPGVAITWDAEEYKDADFTHSTSSSSENIVVGTTGLYRIISHVGFDSTISSDRVVILYPPLVQEHTIEVLLMVIYLVFKLILYYL